MRKLLFISLLVICVCVKGIAQNPPPNNQQPPRSDSPAKSQQMPRSDSPSAEPSSEEGKLPGEEGAAPPLSPGESSSRDSIMDLSPPKGDDLKHSGADEAADTETDSDVDELKPWNPHKAQKDIEIGDYYAKQKNYRAAISRYREALEYKPKDALATFKLAEGLERVNAYQEARDNYEAYLIILPHGPLADKAKQGINRLKDKSKNRPRLANNGDVHDPTAQSSQNPR